MTKQIKAFGSNDIEVIFDFAHNNEINGLDIELNEENHFVVPVERIVVETDSIGNAKGIFELGSELYDNQKNVFENVMRNESEMDIIISPKQLTHGFGIDPIVICERCMIDQKRIVICTPQSGVVHTQYYFSNYSVDWEKDNLELPEHIVKPAFNPDPLFKIARGLEGIKKVMLDREERMDSDNDNILTVEEFTKFMLKSGVVPIISKY